MIASKMQFLHRALAAIALLVGLMAAGCASLSSPAKRTEMAEGLAQQHGWGALNIPAGQFDLRAYLPLRSIQATSESVLTIYIEGDGFAWLTPRQPSLDPTPRQPTALELALAQPEGMAAYLARPCQFTGGIAARGCRQEYWTTARFAPEVIAASMRAIDLLKTRMNARRLVLVGYSGGGAVAALVAAERTDVIQLITVAGNLDHAAWTAHHHVSGLDASLNPADKHGTLSSTPQVHYAGSNDTTVPPEIARQYASRFPPNSPLRVQVVADQDHSCCWTSAWPRLYREARGGR